MTKMKKIAACAFAAAAMMTSVLSMGANAAVSYPESGTWQFYSNPHVSNMTRTINLVAYGNGYRAKITNKSYGGSYNYVTITNGGKQVAMLTEQNQPCNTIKVSEFEKGADGTLYASFFAMMHYETATDTTTATNNGIIGTTSAV